jgi:hypothetical protein
MVQFKAGSYSLDGAFFRSIERNILDNNIIKTTMILINTKGNYSKSEEAALHSKMDIDLAQKKALASNGERTIDHELVTLGYNILEK